MFQLKQILILEKDNPSKNKRQFLKDDLIKERELSKPDWPCVLNNCSGHLPQQQSLAIKYLRYLPINPSWYFQDHCLIAKPKYVWAWGLKLMSWQCPSESRIHGSINWQVTPVLKQHSSPRPSHNHHARLLLWCCCNEMPHQFYARCNRTHTRISIQSLVNQKVAWQMQDEPLCSFWSALEISHGSHFCLVSFLLSNHELWP